MQEKVKRNLAYLSAVLAFEELVRELLRGEGFKISPPPEQLLESFDIVAQRKSERFAVEVKYYLTQRAQPSLLDTAASRLVSGASSADTNRAMLVVSCSMPPALRDGLSTRHSIAVVDRSDLSAWAAKSPQLLARLEALLEFESTIPKQDAQTTFDALKTPPLLLHAGPGPVDHPGTKLEKELRTLHRGRKTWRRYEHLCDRILQYLFSDDLLGWHKQKRTDDGLSRFDYVCRVKPTTDFWRFLVDQVGSRYILFEFKNYAKAIKQGQILTTEKYLLDKGLRRAAIVLTRVGAHESAMAMTQGAMREAGKLILVVDDQSVCEMLQMKDRGEDPTDLLFSLADDFLLKLPR